MNHRWAGLLHRWPRLALLALASFGVLVSASAQAQIRRLEIFENRNGDLYRKWSDDGGYTWSNSVEVPIWAEFRCTELLYNDRTKFAVIGNPAVVSDQAGRVRVVVKTGNGLLENVFTNNDLNGGISQGNGWCRVPGDGGPGVFFNGPGGWAWHLYNADSSPAFASWGPGRLELFMNVTNQANGNIELLHTWGDNGNWSGNWEVLGTGIFTGSPAAVSWGPGRTDVFVGGIGQSLSHKWFDGGHWSSGWEYLGGYLTSSPSVTSPGPNRLNIYVRGGDAHLWSIWYAFGWGSWGDLGGILGSAASPSAASREPLTLDILVLGSDNATGYQGIYNYYQGGWLGFSWRGPLATNFAMAYWTYYPPTPPQGPGDPPPDPQCLRACP